MVEKLQLVWCSEASQSFHLNDSETVCILYPAQGESDPAVREEEGEGRGRETK